MYSTFAWAKSGADSEFDRIEIQRNKTGDDDVTLDIKFCGICGFDVHTCDNDMGDTKYPCVPGHELAGVVTKVGKNVVKYKVGDRAGIGCIVDSCLNCEGCDNGEEQLCRKGFTMNYNGDIKHGHIATGSGWTYGGYSRSYTVHSKFVVRIPDGFPLEAAGPVLCAGVTMFSPLVHWKANQGGVRVGIVGLGGLGQMGLMLSKAMGNTVTAISSSANKETAAKEMGADKFVLSTDSSSMSTASQTLDLILNTVSVSQDLNQYLPLLANKGVLVQLGVTFAPHPVHQLELMFRKLSIAGSLIGGLSETQDCIDFCHRKNIIPKIKLVTVKDLDGVYNNLRTKNDSLIRNVLDIEASKLMG